MKNFEKYKTVDERAKEFSAHCEKTNCEECGVRDKSNGELGCVLGWLDLEAEEDEKPLPCPFCGNNLVSIEYDNTSPMSYSVKCCCGYSSERTPDKSLTIYKHNQVARAAMKEVKNEAD